MLHAQIMGRHKMAHERFSLLAAKVTLHEPPCMSDAEDWEVGHSWVDDLAPPPEPAAALPPMPDPAGAPSAVSPGLGSRVNDAGLKLQSSL